MTSVYLLCIVRIQDNLQKRIFTFHMGPGINVTSSGMVVDNFTYWAILPAQTINLTQMHFKKQNFVYCSFYASWGL